MIDRTARTAAFLLLAAALVSGCDTGTDVATPASLEIDVEPSVLYVGERTQLEVTVLDRDQQPVAADVVFRSSDADVARVNATGEVTAVAPGTAEITAEAGGIAEAIEVRVTEAAASLELFSPVDLLKRGQSAELDVAVRNASGDPIPGGRVDFASTDTAVATVSDDGVVVGTGGGPEGLAVAGITASAGAPSDAVEVLVFEAADYCASGLVLPVGTAVRTVLQAIDCTEIFGGEFADLWFLEIEQPTTVTIEMASDDFDAYLVLEDEEINVVAEDDDSGTGTDARITQELPAGGYWILSTSDAVGESGVYTLTVTGDAEAGYGEAGYGEGVAATKSATIRASSSPRSSWMK